MRFEHVPSFWKTGGISDGYRIAAITDQQTEEPIMPRPFRRSPGIASLGIGFAMLVVSCGKDALPPIGPTPAQLTPY